MTDSRGAGAAPKPGTDAKPPAAAPAVPNDAPRKLFQSGFKHWEAQDYKSAFADFKSAADQGYAPAQDQVALMYEEAKGVPQNYIEAHRYYQKAIDQKYKADDEKSGPHVKLKAMENKIYRTQFNRTHEPSTVIQYLEHLVSQNDLKALRHLGEVYSGYYHYVPPDQNKGIEYLEKAFIRSPDPFEHRMMAMTLGLIYQLLGNDALYLLFFRISGMPIRNDQIENKFVNIQYHASIHDATVNAFEENLITHPEIILPLLLADLNLKLADDLKAPELRRHPVVLELKYQTENMIRRTLLAPSVKDRPAFLTAIKNCKDEKLQTQLAVFTARFCLHEYNTSERRKPAEYLMIATHALSYIKNPDLLSVQDKFFVGETILDFLRNQVMHLEWMREGVMTDYHQLRRMGFYCIRSAYVAGVEAYVASLQPETTGVADKKKSVPPSPPVALDEKKLVPPPSPPAAASDEKKSVPPPTSQAVAAEVTPPDELETHLQHLITLLFPEDESGKYEDLKTAYPSRYDETIKDLERKSEDLRLIGWRTFSNATRERKEFDEFRYRFEMARSENQDHHLRHFIAGLKDRKDEPLRASLTAIRRNIPFVKMFHEAKYAYDNQQYSVAAQTLQTIVKGCDMADAHYLLATLYWDGKGIAQDEKQASVEFKAAEGVTDPDRQFHVATFFRKSGNEEKALALDIKAAKQGHFQALLRVVLDYVYDTKNKLDVRELFDVYIPMLLRRKEMTPMAIARVHMLEAVARDQNRNAIITDESIAEHYSTAIQHETQSRMSGTCFDLVRKEESIFNIDSPDKEQLFSLLYASTQASYSIFRDIARIYEDNKIERKNLIYAESLYRKVGDMKEVERISLGIDRDIRNARDDSERNMLAFSAFSWYRSQDDKTRMYRAASYLNGDIATMPIRRDFADELRASFEEDKVSAQEFVLYKPEAPGVASEASELLARELQILLAGLDHKEERVRSHAQLSAEQCIRNGYLSDCFELYQLWKKFSLAHQKYEFKLFPQDERRFETLRVRSEYLNRLGWKNLSEEIKKYEQRLNPLEEKILDDLARFRLQFERAPALKDELRIANEMFQYLENFIKPRASNAPVNLAWIQRVQRCIVAIIQNIELLQKQRAAPPRTG